MLSHMTGDIDTELLVERCQRESKLVRDCVKSVVYHLRTDIENLDDEKDKQLEEELAAGTASEATKFKVRTAEWQVYWSTIRMKHLLGCTLTGGGLRSWIRVADGDDYKWVVIDEASLLLLIHTTLGTLCGIHKLKLWHRGVGESDESWGSVGVWKEGKWYPSTNIPEEVARSSWHPPYMPCRIEACGRDAKPAEDAPVLWPSPRKIAIAARNNRLREIDVAARSEARPVTVRIESDESDAETASSAEGSTTATDEAPAIRAYPKRKRRRTSSRP